VTRQAPPPLQPERGHSRVRTTRRAGSRRGNALELRIATELDRRTGTQSALIPAPACGHHRAEQVSGAQDRGRRALYPLESLRLRFGTSGAGPDQIRSAGVLSDGACVTLIRNAERHSSCVVRRPNSAGVATCAGRASRLLAGRRRGGGGVRIGSFEFLIGKAITSSAGVAPPPAGSATRVFHGVGFLTIASARSHARWRACESRAVTEERTCALRGLRPRQFGARPPPATGESRGDDSARVHPDLVVGFRRRSKPTPKFAGA
jgi:hypothetical protein